MNAEKVLVIHTNTFNEIKVDSEVVILDNKQIEYKQVGNWFFIAGERNHDAFPYYLKFATDKNINIIVIHKGEGDKNYNKLCEVAQQENINVEILGFHTTEREIVNRIEKCDYSVIEELKKNKVKEQITLLLHRIAHLFLPMDIDLMGICEVLKNDFKPPQGKTKEKWAEEYYNEAFKNTSPKDRFKNLCDQARKEIERAKLEDDKKEAILQMFNCDNINLGLPNEFDIDKFKKWAENPEQNPFHQWFCNVMRKLEEIKKEYSGKSDVKGNEDKKGQ